MYLGHDPTRARVARRALRVRCQPITVQIDGWRPYFAAALLKMPTITSSTSTAAMHAHHEAHISDRLPCVRIALRPHVSRQLLTTFALAECALQPPFQSLPRRRHSATLAALNAHSAAALCRSNRRCRHQHPPERVATASPLRGRPRLVERVAHRTSPSQDATYVTPRLLHARPATERRAFTGRSPAMHPHCTRYTVHHATTLRRRRWQQRRRGGRAGRASEGLHCAHVSSIEQPDLKLARLEFV